jgi:hypothetical protein
MSTTILSKRATPGALMQRLLVGKFEALRYLPKLASSFLMFNSAGELVADDYPSFSLRNPQSSYTVDGAIAVTGGTHLIAKTSAAAMTIAAPTAADAGLRLTIQANTDFAHVITFTGSTLLDGTTGANLTVTLTAFKGSCIVIEAVGTKWHLVSSSNVTSITA